MAARADINAKIAAKGIADLTVEVQQQFGQQQKQIDQLRAEMNERFGRFDSVDNRFEQIDNRFEQVIIEQAELRKEMNLKFAQVAQTQEQILTLLLDRLK